MKVLLTGAAGFIGFHVAKALLVRGEEVVGVDNLNDYYDVKLKQARLDQLTPHKSFSFHKLDVADKEAMLPLVKLNPTHIMHMAAQAGVRYSLENPYAYISSNVMGHTVMLELARAMPQLKHFVYASSSSVYGDNTKVPFAETDPVERPVSLYAATKRAAELIAWTYAHLFNVPCTGLRFFTVYGPWGRPDMAPYIFAKHISEGAAVPVFNHGKMKRDFTYIDDVVAGVLAALARPHLPERGEPPARFYNLGNSHSEDLMNFIAAIEKALGKKAKLDMRPMQPGDVAETFADITSSAHDLDYKPKTMIDEGVAKFVAWYKEFYKV